MRRRPVCRLHGGKGGGPKGERNGAHRTGRYTAEAEAERRAARLLQGSFGDLSMLPISWALQLK